MDRVVQALHTAFEQHRGQTRKHSKIPYTVHVLDVARLLLSEPDASEDVVVAGILHDTLEDTPYSAWQMEKEFGPAVRGLVEFATEPQKDRATSMAEKRRTWKSRKEHTIMAARVASTDQLLVLLADKLSNLQSLEVDLATQGDEVWDHFNAPRLDIAWYYTTLRDIFGDKLAATRIFRRYDVLVDEVFGPVGR